MMNKKTTIKKLNDISKEWDIICNKRQKLINQGLDISLIYVTAPFIIKAVFVDHPKTVLDAGCGTGYLTHKIAQHCEYCCGIDISEQSIQIANKNYQQKNLKFVNSSISEFVHDYQFDACVSNMVLMTDPEIHKSLKNIYDLLVPDGKLFIMITHPCFWPSYWNYQNETWFDYKSEIFIQHDFKTSFSNPMGTSTHIHRPLSKYFNIIKESGFEIVSIEEPYPVNEVPKEYSYEYPRFLFIKCKKQ